jgi:hypothetical protein
MNHHNTLATFFNKIISDSNINTTHVTIYMLLHQYWNNNDFQDPIKISRADVMKKTKINSKATYHKCIKDLHANGYIVYNPSYHPIKASQVFMANLIGNKNDFNQ